MQLIVSQITLNYYVMVGRSAPVLRRRGGVCRVFVRQCHLCAVSQLQPPPRLPPLHRVQDPSWLLAQDLQQPGVCSAALPVSQPRI